MKLISEGLSNKHTHKKLFLYFSMQSVQNLGLAVISVVAGKLVDSNGYLVLEVFFLAWLCRKFFTIIYKQVPFNADEA